MPTLTRIILSIIITLSQVRQIWRGGSVINTVENELDLIRKSFLFAGSKPATVEQAAEQALKTEYVKGELIYSRECFYKSLGLIISGSVQVSKPGDDGHNLIISVLAKGSIFGAAALFNDYTEYANNLVAEENSVVLFFKQEHIESLMRSDFKVAENYIRYLSGRIRFLDGKISNLIAGSSEKRLYRYLFDNAKPGADGTMAIELQFSYTELAGRLGIGRASLYRAFDALTEAGIIVRNGKTVELK